MVIFKSLASFQSLHACKVQPRMLFRLNAVYSRQDWLENFVDALSTIESAEDWWWWMLCMGWERTSLVHIMYGANNFSMKNLTCVIKWVNVRKLIKCIVDPQQIIIGCRAPWLEKKFKNLCYRCLKSHQTKGNYECNEVSHR